MGIGSLCAFQENVIVGVGTGTHFLGWPDPESPLANGAKRSLDFAVTAVELRTTDHFFILRINVAAHAKLHVRFKDWVRTRRGRRLKADDDALFDGGYMLGEQALSLGLIDGFSTVDELVRQLGGDRARARRIAPKRSRLLGRLPRLTLDVLLDALEDRSWRINLR